MYASVYGWLRSQPLPKESDVIVLDELLRQLKPCPFCGVTDVMYSYIRDGRQLFCRRCGASAGPKYNGPKDDMTARLIASCNTPAKPSRARV